MKTRNDKISSWIERTMPHDEQESLKRRNVVKKVGAAATVLIVTLGVASGLNNNGSENRERDEPFNGDKSVVRIHTSGSGEAKARSSADTGFIGMSNLLGTISPNSTIETDNGVKVVCHENDVYRADITGEEVQRYWVGVPGYNIMSTLDNSVASLADHDTVWIANDRIDIETDGSVTEYELLRNTKCE